MFLGGRTQVTESGEEGRGFWDLEAEEARFLFGLECVTLPPSLSVFLKLACASEISSCDSVRRTRGELTLPLLHCRKVHHP